MRVAHLMAGATAGGAELFYERLVAAQAQAGEQVLAVIRRDEQRAARLRAAGLDARQLGFGGPLDLLTRQHLRRLLRRFAPRVVVAWMNRAANAAPRGGWVLAGRLGGFYDLSYYRRCDHLIGNTAGIVRWIREQGWDAARVHHLPNFARDYAGQTPAPPDWLPPGAPFLFALGRLHRNKGFDVLIRAMRLLPQAWLLIAGEGPERQGLEALARREGVAGRVRLPGWNAAPAGLLAACDVLVCPSRHEPLGNVVIEAFSARRPVVAAAADGPRELIRDGVDGLLAPLDDPAGLAARLARVLDDPALAARLAAAGRERFELEFAAEPVLARWRGFLAQVGRA